jgi:hypothetical protein
LLVCLCNGQSIVLKCVYEPLHSQES